MRPFPPPPCFLRSPRANCTCRMCRMRGAGRKPRTETLNCDKAGVKLDDKGAVVVDEAMKTSADTIYAIGDVIDVGPHCRSPAAAAPCPWGTQICCPPWPTRPCCDVVGGVEGWVDYMLARMRARVLSVPLLGACAPDVRDARWARCARQSSRRQGVRCTRVCIPRAWGVERKAGCMCCEHGQSSGVWARRRLPRCLPRCLPAMRHLLPAMPQAVRPLTSAADERE